MKISNEFWTEWNFPNCLGAIDGKLVHVQRPINCGAQYFNYKRSFSVNMMAVVDAHYQFLYVCVGAQGSANDASVFNASSFGKATKNSNNPLCLPPTTTLPHLDIETPMVFVADEAYPLTTYLMKPFSSRGFSASERIYNYRLSRARRVVENAFGILVNRFRILRGNMQLQPNQVNDVVLACCVLHNFMRKQSSSLTQNSTSADQQEPDRMEIVQHVPRKAGANYNSSAKKIRDKLATYSVTGGQVSWQWKYGIVAVDNQ